MSKPANAIRVLVVDDSVVIRGALGRIIDAEPDMRVVTTAQNGRVALEALRNVAVDVVLLDIEMPEMDGLAVLPQIVATYPETRVVMASSLTQHGAEVTMRALALGAADYIPKPAAKSGAASLTSVSGEIASKIRAIGRAARGRRLPPPRVAVPTAPVRTELLATPAGSAPPKVLAVAASTGGPNALAAMLAGLPADFPLPILITQHMPPVFTALLSQRLERDTGRRCREAKDGERVEAGITYVAPGDFHLLVHTHEGEPYLRLGKGEPENFCRPAADPMFRSIAAIYGASTLAVVLTGMGEDGMRGCREIRQRGGYVIVQDQSTSVVWGMPGAVADAGLAQAVLPLPALAPAILQHCGVAAA